MPQHVNKLRFFFVYFVVNFTTKGTKNARRDTKEKMSIY